jgi:hypothetical protein
MKKRGQLGKAVLRFFRAQSGSTVRDMKEVGI